MNSKSLTFYLLLACLVAALFAMAALFLPGGTSLPWNAPAQTPQSISKASMLEDASSRNDTASLDLSEFDSIEEFEAQWQAMKARLQAFSRDNPRALLDLLRGSETFSSLERARLFNRIAAALEAEALVGLLDYLLAMPREDWATGVYHHLQFLLGALAQQDPHRLLAFLDAHEALFQGQKTRFEVAAMRELAKTDPEQAWETALQRLDPTNWRTHQQLLSGIAADDPLKALALYEQLPESQRNSRVYQTIFSRWIQKEPRLALDTALRAPVPQANNERLFFIRDLGTQWYQGDAEQALAWAEALPSEEDRGIILEGMISELALHDESAAQSYIEDLPPGSVQSRVARKTALHSIYSDPASIAEWAEWAPAQLQNDWFGQDFHETLVKHWADTDLPATAEWVAELPENELREVAVGELVSELHESEPESAFLWSETIQDPVQRHVEMERAARNWMNEDPVAARNGITASNLPETMKAQLLNR